LPAVDLLLSVPVCRDGWHLRWFLLSPFGPSHLFPAVVVALPHLLSAHHSPVSPSRCANNGHISRALARRSYGFLFRTSLEKLRVYAASVPAFWVSLVLMRPGYDGLDRGSRGQAASHQLLPPRPTLSAAITARPHLQRHGEEGGGKARLAFGPIRLLGKASRPF